jgi:uncharacterized protein YbjT (DUF2867 family)
VAAAALTQVGHTGQIYTLTGNELLTVRQQVEILAGVLGRAIAFVEITPEESALEVLASGVDPATVEATMDLTERQLADQWAIMTDDVGRITGQRPASFASWCRRHVAAFAG